jgi:uncharacterized membrane protein
MRCGEQMDLVRLALLGHLLAVFVFVAGYVGTNVLTEIARRAGSLEERRAALAMSGRFDRWLYQRGGTAVLISGPVVLWAFGYPIAAPWVVASSGLFLLIPALGGLYWAPIGRRVDEAIARGDDATAARLLTARRNVLMSRFENFVLIVIIVLMVYRPG